MVERDNLPLAAHSKLIAHLGPVAPFVLGNGVGLAPPQPPRCLIALLELGLCLTSSYLVSSPLAVPGRAPDREQVSPQPPR